MLDVTTLYSQGYSCPDSSEGDYCNPVSFDPNQIALHPSYVQQGWPSNMQTLLNIFGNSTTVGTTTLYASVGGTVAGNSCSCGYHLGIQGTMSDMSTFPRFIIQTKEKGLDNNGPEPLNADNWKQVAIFDTICFPTDVTFVQFDNGGAGCGDNIICGHFYGTGPNDGWNACQPNIKVVQSIQMINWCSISNSGNMGTDMCYNFVGNYVDDSWAMGVSPGQQVTTAVQDYCQTKYPDGTLDMFSPECTLENQNDCDMCACNMQQSDYDQFMLSLGPDATKIAPAGLAPKCLFPPCNISNFQMNGSDGCPVPNCLNIVSMNGNKIVTNGGVTIDQSAECGNLGIGNNQSVDTTKDSEGWSTTQKIAAAILTFLAVILVSILFYLLIRSTSKDHED